MKYEVQPGETIHRAAESAVALARDKLDFVSFEFNGIPIKASPLSYWLDLVDLYYARHEIRSLQSPTK